MEATRLLHPIPETCALLSVGRSKLYEEIAAGHIETVKVGSRTLVPHSALVAYVEHLRRSESVPAA